MEELHLKSLSPGLGFVEKQKTLKQEAQDSQAFQKVGPLSIPSVPKDLLLKKINLDEPDAYDRLLSSLKNPWLNESEHVEKTMPETVTTPSSIPVGSQQKIWPQPPLTNPASPTSKYKTWPQQTIPPVSTAPKTNLVSSQESVFFSLKSLLIDSLCSSILFFPALCAFTFLTHSQPLTVFTSLGLEIIFGFLFFHQIYQMAWRVFCLETYGEMLTHRKLAYKNELNKEVHPLLHLWRFLFMTITGFITFPILSIIFKKDLTGKLTGLYFQKIKN